MIEEILISRYKERLKNVYKNPSPYYQFPSWEKSEIEQWINKLEKIKERICKN